MKQTVSGSVRPTTSAWPAGVLERRGQIGGRLERCGPGPGGQPGRIGERGPPVGRLDGPADGPAAVPPDPQRRTGPLARDGAAWCCRRPGSRTPSRVTLSPVQAASHGGQRLVHPVVAVGEGDAQRVELGFEVAGAQPDHHPAAAQHVEGGDPLGGQERVAVGQHEQVGVEQDRGGGRGGERQGHQRVEGVVAAVGQPVVAGERDGRWCRRRRTRRPRRPPPARRWPRGRGTPRRSRPGGWAGRRRRALRSGPRADQRRPGTPASATGDPARRPPRAR